jgi:hypothetical protein
MDIVSLLLWAGCARGQYCGIRTVGRSRKESPGDTEISGHSRGSCWLKFKLIKRLKDWASRSPSRQVAKRRETLFSKEQGEAL